ncbi:spore coat protein [Anoxybacteroides tepidamans]|uniref:spore coat protein n=1 Tax=Anoxybacteroides tepidamans TaxID=265948 RepID=UPI0004867937|nr:spore coat protein [Anoxybacillus tepidamans]
MNGSANQPNGIPNKVIDLLVSDVFKKNGINPKQIKKNLSKEEKNAIKALVDDLSKQVEAFVSNTQKTKKPKQ